MKKIEYCAPKAEVFKIVFEQSVLTDSGETEMGASRGGYDTPLGGYDSEWN